MSSTVLLDQFFNFALAAGIGFLIGLERSMAGRERKDVGVRDFVLFALLGAVSTFVSDTFESIWFVALGFVGLLVLLAAYYWRSNENNDRDPGITSELAAVLTFLFAVLAVREHHALAIALAVVTTAMLAQKQRLIDLRDRVQRFELNAALKLLVISFIILPVLPQEPLDRYLTLPLGEVMEANEQNKSITVKLVRGHRYESGDRLRVYGGPYSRQLGVIQIESATSLQVTGIYKGEYFDQLTAGEKLRAEIGIPILSVMTSAIEPYRVWWIVVLVSSIGFLGYVLAKAVGGRVGMSLTGVVGGMASSTATALSFSKRSAESPQWNRQFAVAILLASTVMFPRLLVQIAVVDLALMRRMAMPILVMAGTGILLALRHLLFTRETQAEHKGPLGLENPFSLKSALTFGLVFAIVLMVTRVAITYLGGAWLPVVAVVSGLTDADAIVFSVSSAHSAGLITLDWAAFNAVLGAIANTVMKLFLVLTLGNRGLFKFLWIDILVVSVAGLAAAFLCYGVGVSG